MSKTNLGLVEYARGKIGTPYVYGMKMAVLTQAKFDSLQKTYGKSYVWDSDASKVGKVCCDCSGLISSYTGVTRGSSQYKSAASKVYAISTIADAPIGALVWMSGHIGIYSGVKNGVHYYIAEDGSAYGCREVPLSYNKFTHWFLCSDIEYVEEDDEVVENIQIQLNGTTKTVEAINKEGTNYVKLRDLADSKITIDYDSSKNLPIVSVDAVKNLEIELNGTTKSVEAINSDGFNYVKLRDLADDKITVGYDSSKAFPVVEVK